MTKVLTLEGQPIAWRVTTPKLTSLGLKNNTNILDYSDAVANWSTYELPEENVVEGKGDWGGIWVTRTLPDARRIRKYMAEKHQIDGCRIFLVTLGRVLYQNSYRIKTDAITFVEEIKVN